jgi:excisionase family DNA binding protein
VDQLIDIREASRILAVKSGTLYRWVNEGRLESVKVFGALRFKVSTIQSLIDEGTNPPVKELPEKR